VSTGTCPSAPIYNDANAYSTGEYVARTCPAFLRDYTAANPWFMSDTRSRTALGTFMQCERSCVHITYKIERRDDWRSIGVRHEVSKGQLKIPPKLLHLGQHGSIICLIAR
jgi:hypothetical protein